MHGLAEIFTGLGLIGGQLAFAHDPASGEECGQSHHGYGDPAIPWESWGGGGGWVHRERVWRISSRLKPPLVSCPQGNVLHDLS